MAGRVMLFVCTFALLETAVGFRFQRFSRLVLIDTGSITGHAISLCSEHIPESASASTVCWSSCAETQSKATCNGQAETWQFVLQIPSKPFKEAAPGYEGCALNEKRFLCSLSETLNSQCTENAGTRHTRNLVLQQYLGCEGGTHRTRCRRRTQIESLTENLVVKPQRLPVE
ncbi:hypothetical protein BESB_008870 [Besnoitia besnoiti]|uniref:Thrombospondin type 1 domain-containing protein n=1 Tax=Besnoitia besnoiti TaxID=94643 RepID=A0A2A9MKM7_BESBE|nr:hypothetical protein BESB_008870 [Besnoitia besnoiti]PFH38545.1 hypothetical protein BESB_008870 [Besnoitia besnoiti]